MQYTKAFKHLVPFIQLVVPFLETNSLPNDVLVQILLYGCVYGEKDLSNEINKNLLEPTLDFIHKTGQFD